MPNFKKFLGLHFLESRHWLTNWQHWIHRTFGGPKKENMKNQNNLKALLKFEFFHSPSPKKSIYIQNFQICTHVHCTLLRSLYTVHCLRSFGCHTLEDLYHYSDSTFAVSSSWHPHAVGFAVDDVRALVLAVSTTLGLYYSMTFTAVCWRRVKAASRATWAASFSDSLIFEWMAIPLNEALPTVTVEKNPLVSPSPSTDTVLSGFPSLCFFWQIWLRWLLAVITPERFQI